MIRELADHIALLEGNHLVALSVRIDSSDKDVKKAWRAFALRYHPDKNTRRADTSTLFRCVQAAYEVLSDPDLRATYVPAVEPGAWMARRAAETRKLAALEQVSFSTPSSARAT